MPTLTHSTFPNVSIVLVNWQGADDTLACLDSLHELDYSNFGVIVVDNGSADNSVERILTMYPDLTLLQSGSNKGFSGGNNVGIRYALDHGANYVWLLNNDTTVDRNALRAMVQLAEHDSAIGAVSSVLFHMDRPEVVQAWGGGRIGFVTGRSRNLVKQGKLDYLTGASLLVKRAVFEEVGLLDEGYFMYWEDADFCLSIRRAGWRLAVAEESVVYHKESSSVGRKSVAQDVYFNASAVRFFRRNSRVPIVGVVIGGGGRLLKRLLVGDFKRTAAVALGLREGLMASRSLRNK